MNDMEKRVIPVAMAILMVGCSLAQSNKGNKSADELIDQRIESIGKQGQEVFDMIQSPNTGRSEFITALGALYDTLSYVIQHDESFDITRACRGYARSLSGDLMRSELPFPMDDSVMDLFFKMAICGYYWNMPPSANNLVCGTTALTSGNDYDRLANVFLINAEDEEAYDLFGLVIIDDLGDINNLSVKLVGEGGPFTLDTTQRGVVEFHGRDNTEVHMIWPIEYVLDALIPGDKVLELSYTAGGQEINMTHVLLPLPEEWLRKLQMTK